MTGIRAIISLMKRYLILLGLILEYNQVFILYCAVQEWGILYLVQKSLHDFRLISKKIRSISFYNCKLNSYGYVTEVTEDNDEKDGAIYYTLEYDKNGYLQRIEQRYSYNESRKRVSECTWRDGNLIESKLTDYYEDGTDITTVKYSYSKTTTPINIDLFYIDGGYIDVLEPLDLLGFYGRQSAKLPNKADITYSGESESESDDFGVYTLNGDGTVARIDCGSVSYELIY